MTINNPHYNNLNLINILRVSERKSGFVGSGGTTLEQILEIILDIRF